MAAKELDITIEESVSQKRIIRKKLMPQGKSSEDDTTVESQDRVIKFIIVIP